jgi:dolichol-phosphate mannosyltransferase
MTNKALIAPLADVGIFIWALSAGFTLSAAHIVSFVCATLVNHALTLRAGERSREPRLYVHLLVVALAVLFLRGGVLALLVGWGLPAQWAILFVVAVSTWLLRSGNSLCLSTGVWSIDGRALAIALITYAVLLRLIYSGRVELLPEETYYWNYSQHLAPGYLDHPPMVAWLIWGGTTLFGTTEFGVRFGAMITAGIASLFVYRLTRNLFDGASALVALVLMQLLPFFFFAGIMMTPDAPLLAAWAALLYYLERALIANRASAWWGAGISLGLGLLSKYTILMIAPAACIFMLVDAQARRWLWHWLPYTAMVLALVIFSPVIYWNATHEWASFAFQTSRRLAESPRFSLHKLILSVLILLTPVGAVGVWGALRSGADSRRRLFMQLCVFLPLAVFFVFSVRHEVKLDWTGTLWMAAVPALAFAAVTATGGLQGWVRSAWPPTLVILTLILGGALHYFVLGLPGAGYGSHMDLVPIGWRSLGEQVTALEARGGTRLLVVGMDRYNIASELAFYAPDRRRSVANTASDNLFGGVGLMYERWFPPGEVEGRDLLLVGFKPEDLRGPEVEARAQAWEPLQDGVLMRDGRLIRRYYYRIAHHYLAPPATEH